MRVAPAARRGIAGREQTSLEASEFGVIIYGKDGPVARFIFDEPERANIPHVRADLATSPLLRGRRQGARALIREH